MAIRKSGISGIPFGNTAARPASPSLGQPYFNGEVGRLELYSSNGWQNIVQETPGVASASGTYNQSTGSGTFTISGTNFVDGAIAYAVGTNGTEYQATTTTYNSIVQMTALFTGLSPDYEPYDIKVTNPSNLFGLLPDAFYINDSPVWSTSSGSLGTYTGSSIQLAATDDESNTITYTVTSGSLPTGVSLSSSGLISGTATSVGTFTFTVSASDGSNTAVTRSFSLVVYPTITGGTVTVSGDYRIHTFTSSGTFGTNASSLTADYLVVAGGGGGGTSYGGGGGAGGLRSTVTATGRAGTLESSLTLAANNYTVTVGGGGASGLAGYNATNSPGSNGVNSTFSTITALGGGGGGGGGGNAKSGGSGGAGMDALPGAVGTTGQGFDGGGSAVGGVYGAGGGGGAGSAGVSGTSQSGGNGGNGVATSITGSSVTYAGGGGGGTYQGGTVGSGGSGGGGNAAASGNNNAGNGSPGTANTGGGGGGGSALQAGGLYSGVAGVGGSGIVIVRYLKSVVGL